MPVRVAADVVSWTTAARIPVSGTPPMPATRTVRGAPGEHRPVVDEPVLEARLQGAGRARDARIGPADDVHREVDAAGGGVGDADPAGAVGRHPGERGGRAVGGEGRGGRGRLVVAARIRDQRPAARRGEGGQRDRDRADARGRHAVADAEGAHAVRTDAGCRRGCRVPGRVPAARAARREGPGRPVRRRSNRPRRRRPGRCRCGPGSRCRRRRRQAGRPSVARCPVPIGRTPRWSGRRSRRAGRRRASRPCSGRRRAP